MRIKLILYGNKLISGSRGFHWQTEAVQPTKKELYQTSISPAVWQDLCAHQTVYQAHRKTAIDFRLSHVAFVYGLYYPQSKQLLDEQGSIWQMLDFTSQIPSVNQQLDQLRKEIERTIHNTN